MNQPRYACEMPKLGKFLTRFVTYILPFGHFYYVADAIAPGHDLKRIDRKIIEKYQVTHCRKTRKIRRDKGYASVHYVRFQNLFVIIASDGQSTFFEQENWTDIRKTPIYVSGYSLGINRGKSCARIQGLRWNPLKKKFLDMAYYEHRNLQRYYDLITPFRFRGIIEQMEWLRKRINHKRRRASLPLLQPWDWWRGKAAQETFEATQLIS